MPWITFFTRIRIQLRCVWFKNWNSVLRCVSGNTRHFEHFALQLTGRTTTDRLQHSLYVLLKTCLFWVWFGCYDRSLVSASYGSNWFEHMEIDEEARLLFFSKTYNYLCSVDLDDVSNISCVSDTSLGISALTNFAIDKSNRWFSEPLTVLADI